MVDRVKPLLSAYTILFIASSEDLQMLTLCTRLRSKEFCWRIPGARLPSDVKYKKRNPRVRDNGRHNTLFDE
jgi:hypothetical protein